MTKEQIIEQLETSLNGHKGLNEAIDDASFYIAAEFDKLKKLYCINCDETKPTHKEELTISDEAKQIDQNNPVTRGSTALVYKQETLEEAAEHNYPSGDVWTEEQAVIRRLAFKNGANWQAERMYSEAILFAEWIRNNPYIWNYPDKLNDKRTTEELFEQFKKK